MALNYNQIPNRADLLRASQGQILTDYTSINTFISADHYTFGDPKEGKHKFMRSKLTPTPIQTDDVNYGTGYRNFPALNRAFHPADFFAIKPAPGNPHYAFNLNLNSLNLGGFFTKAEGLYTIGENLFLLFFKRNVGPGDLGVVQEIHYPVNLSTYPTSQVIQPFAQAYSVNITVQDMSRFQFDSNIVPYVVDINPTFVNVLSVQRTPAFFTGFAVYYIAVLGSY